MKKKNISDRNFRKCKKKKEEKSQQSYSFPVGLTGFAIIK
jgi:hypothetical protein